VFETIFLIVTLGGEIRVKPTYEPMFNHNPLPESVIKECSEWSGVDPYDKDDITHGRNEFKFLGCVYYDSGDHEDAII